MNKKASPGILILGIFAVLFGLLAAYAVKKHLQAESPEVAAAPQEQKWTVPTALTDLPANRTIRQSDLLVLNLTREELAKQNLPGAWMNRTSQIIGRTLRQPVKRGQAFEPSLFYPEGIGPSVAAQLAPGERAMTIPFEGSAAEAGLITPASHVDVLFRTSGNGRSQPSEITVTLLENVKVLAIDQQTLDGAAAAGTGSQGTVTLAVSPVQARALKVVEGRGSLTLALRNGDDGAPVHADGPRNLDDLLGLRQEKPFTTEIYRRGHLTTVSFQDGRREVVFEQTPYGIPVAKEPRTDFEPDVTQNAPPATPASLAVAAGSDKEAAASAPDPGRPAKQPLHGIRFPINN